MAYRNKKA